MTLVATQKPLLGVLLISLSREYAIQSGNRKHGGSVGMKTHGEGKDSAKLPGALVPPFLHYHTIIF